MDGIAVGSQRAATLRGVRVALGVLLGAMLALSGCGAPPQPPTPAPAPTAPPTPVPTPEAVADGVRYDIGGRRMFLSCAGAGSPTVLLEAGLAADHTGWDLVQPGLAKLTRVCSYDRAGLGRSDPATTPRTSAAVVADLRALLDAAGERGPYVLVAHSFGALHARAFTAAYPAEVAALVLVDAVHEDWWRRSLELLPPAAPGDSPRLQSFRAFLAEGVADPAANAEGIDIPATADELRAAGDLGDRPLVVLRAAIFDVLAPGLPPAVAAQLKILFQEELPGRMAALSTDSTVVTVPDSGHNIPQQRPDLVVVAVQAVLAAARG